MYGFNSLHSYTRVTDATAFREQNGCLMITGSNGHEISFVGTSGIGIYATET